MRYVATAALAIALLAGLSACGEEPTSSSREPAASASDPTASPPGSTRSTSAAAALPACGEVWVSGRTLPADYAGCRAGNEVVEARPVVCESMQQLYVHGDHLWAIGGARIMRTDGPYTQDAHYRKVYRACVA